MEQTHEMQLAQLYVLGFRQVIACYNVVSTLHESGPRVAKWKLTSASCDIVTSLNFEVQCILVIITEDVCRGNEVLINNSVRQN